MEGGAGQSSGGGAEDERSYNKKERHVGMLFPLQFAGMTDMEEIKKKKSHLQFHVFKSVRSFLEGTLRIVRKKSSKKQKTEDQAWPRRFQR